MPLIGDASLQPDPLPQGSPETNRERVSRRMVDKFAERRAELAGAALQALGELGYARTSLREIAQNSRFSYGVLHYYFADKLELILYCVKEYKTLCATRYKQMAVDAQDADALANVFALGLAQTAREDAIMHRLWYDVRSQSMFESSLHPDVLDISASLQEMIWKIVTRYAELSATTLIVGPETAYAIFDGLFQHALFNHLAGSDSALSTLAGEVEQVLPRLVDAARLTPTPHTNADAAGLNH
jgi:AcrR family transcriptional regulator